MDDCIFCQIARGEAPSSVVYEDDETFAFLSIAPDAPGHTLVIPKRHARSLFDMADESLGPVMQTVQKIARALKDSVGAEGVNLIMNNEPVAGQVVFHAHIHVIPRKKGDGLNYEGPRGSYAPGEAEKIVERIKTVLF